MRVFEEKIYRGLKAATLDLVDAFGFLKRAAGASRVSLQMLATYYSPHHPQTFMPIDVMIDLMRKSGDLSPLEYIAGLFGKVLVDCPTGRAGSHEERTRQAIKEMGEAIAEIAKGESEPAMLKELEEAQQAIANLLQTKRVGE
jgi:hypothetical protein